MLLQRQEYLTHAIKSKIIFSLPLVLQCCLLPQKRLLFALPGIVISRMVANHSAYAVCLPGIVLGCMSSQCPAI